MSTENKEHSFEPDAEQHTIPVVVTDPDPEASSDTTKNTIDVFVGIESNPLDVGREAIEEMDRDDIELDTARLGEFDLAQFYDGGPAETDEDVRNGAFDENGGSVQQPDEILRNNAGLYSAKNDDYGDAWRLAGETLSMWAQQNNIETIDPQNPDRAVSWNLFMQRLHKLIRAFNLEFNTDAPNNEALSESHQDESTYAAIHAHHELDRSSEDNK